MRALLGFWGPAVVLPLAFDGGSFVAPFAVGGRPFRAVVDSGSPFVTVASQCGELDRRWGCLAPGGRLPGGVQRSGLGSTQEFYGLQAEDSEWLRADVTLGAESSSAAWGGAPLGGAGSVVWGGVVLPGDGAGAGAGAGGRSRRGGRGRASAGATRKETFPGLIFAASSGVRPKEGGAPGGEAPLLGLVKEASRGIRPTFMSQAGYTGFSMSFDAAAPELALFRGMPPKLAPSETVPLEDLRPRGAPVKHYAARVRKLVVNGLEVDLEGRERPTFAVFDTGTTGALVSRPLFDSTPFSYGTAQCSMEFATAHGGRVQVGQSTRECRRDCLLVCLPIDVPWDADVIFLGLAFLQRHGSLTVDADGFALGLGRAPPLAQPFRARSEELRPPRAIALPPDAHEARLDRLGALG